MCLRLYGASEMLDPRGLPELQLQNGRASHGWAGDVRSWGFRGSIRFHGGKNVSESFLIYTNGKLADFILRLEYRIFAGHAAVVYRSKLFLTETDAVRMEGYYAVLVPANTKKTNFFQGALSIPHKPNLRTAIGMRGQRIRIYEELGVKTSVTGSTGASRVAPVEQPGEWHDLQIEATGRHIRHSIDGELVLDVTDESALELLDPREVLGLLPKPDPGLLALCVLEAGTHVEFRNLTVFTTTKDFRPVAPFPEKTPRQSSRPQPQSSSTSPQSSPPMSGSRCEMVGCSFYLKNHIGPYDKGGKPHITQCEDVRCAFHLQAHVSGLEWRGKDGVKPHVTLCERAGCGFLGYKHVGPSEWFGKDGCKAHTN